MQDTGISILNFKIERETFTHPKLKELYNLEKLPLSTATVEFEAKGVNVAIINGFRRTITDEISNNALEVSPTGFNFALTTDKFILYEFVIKRISLIPLKLKISPKIVGNLVMRLDVYNDTTDIKYVYSGDMEIVKGDLKDEIFNPTFIIAQLNPGTRLVVDDIKIVSGIGRNHAKFMMARRAIYEHLDIEQYSKEETHNPGGKAVSFSGYKQSCLVANPKHHRFTSIFAATSENLDEINSVLIDTCENIKNRLRRVLSAMIGKDGFDNITYTEVKLNNNTSEGIIGMFDETFTISEIIKRSVYELFPNIINIGARNIKHDTKIEIRIVADGNIVNMVKTAIEYTINLIDAMQLGFK
jgi:hypothetical protein